MIELTTNHDNGHFTSYIQVYIQLKMKLLKIHEMHEAIKSNNPSMYNTIFVKVQYYRSSFTGIEEHQHCDSEVECTNTQQLSLVKETHHNKLTKYNNRQKAPLSINPEIDYT